MKHLCFEPAPWYQYSGKDLRISIIFSLSEWCEDIRNWAGVRTGPPPPKMTGESRSIWGRRSPRGWKAGDACVATPSSPVATALQHGAAPSARCAVRATAAPSNALRGGVRDGRDSQHDNHAQSDYSFYSQ